MRLLLPAIQYSWMSPIKPRAMPRLKDIRKKTDLKPDVIRLQGKRQKLPAQYGAFQNPDSPLRCAVGKVKPKDS